MKSTLPRDSINKRDASLSLSYSNPAHSEFHSEVKKEDLALSLADIPEEGTEENSTSLSLFSFRFKGRKVMVTPTSESTV